jgi:hypothetical protein
MVIKMMWGKKESSIEDVISEKQIKFSSNLQDEATKKCHIQSIQVEEIVQITELHGICWSAFDDSSLFSHALVLEPSATIMWEASSDAPRCI